jgi:hypothetical protein
MASYLQITKQERQAHVILATSDYSFLDWLSMGECIIPDIRTAAGQVDITNSLNFATCLQIL